MASSSTTNLPVLQDYDTIIKGTLSSFVALSNKIGGELPAMVDRVTRLFDAQKQFIQKAMQIKKPENDSELQAMIRPQSTEIEGICGK